MSSVMGSRRGHALGKAVGGDGNGGVLGTARSQRSVRRHPSVPMPAQGLPEEIQRNRILSAAIRSIEEVGYADASVAHITSRARVSRRTFYDLFESRDACLLAAFEDMLGLIGRDLAAAGLDGLPWRERVRLGLWTILCFLEREPALAHVCVVQSLRTDVAIVARREALLAELTAVLDEGHDESARAAQATPLTAEVLLGAALTIVHTRLQRAERAPLTDLLGELMGLIVLPYLGPQAAKRERTRPAPAPPPAQPRRSLDNEPSDGDPVDGISMRLTYRTMRVLECVAADPGASNRRLSTYAGISDQGQISKLLARLERLGLLANEGKSRPKGEANAWRLTPAGSSFARSAGLGARNVGEGVSWN
jgi:AcrR family transcriptional regulator